MSDGVGPIEELYAARYRRLVGQLAGLVGDVATAEDVVQEAFLTALQRPRAFRRLENPEGWLRSAAIGASRRRWRRTSAWRVLAPRLPTRPLTDDELSAHDHAVLDAVRRLPAAQREVVALHHLADLTVEQVAQTLGTRSATVRTRLASGCESLDGLLAQGRPPSPGPGSRTGPPLCPEDLGRLRATGGQVESSIHPPPFARLVEGVQHRRRRRVAGGALLALLLAAGGSTAALLGGGPDRTVPPVSASTTSHAPAAGRAASIITASARLMMLEANPKGYLLGAFAGCPDPTTCESAWRLVDPQRREVARGILTGAANPVTAFEDGFVVTDLDGGFAVRNDGTVKQLEPLRPPREVRAGDVILPFGRDATIAYRPQDGQISQLVVARQPDRPAAWYTTKVDARGWIWVLGGGQDGPTTTLFHSSDQGRSWQSHDIGPGAPGELVLAGETMHVVTLGDCAYECIVGGSTSVDHGRTWTSWPAVSNRYLYDLAPGAGDRLFLRTGDTTATARSPQVLVSAQPATGMVDLPAWHLPSPSDDVGLLTSSGSTLWFGRDASTLLRSDDNGQSWTGVPAR